MDLSAFGVGVKFDDIDHFKKGVAEIERKISMFSSRYGRLIQNLKELNCVMDNLMIRLCAMAERYDERMQMITRLNSEQEALCAMDPYQMQVLEKTYNYQAFKEKMMQPVKRVTIMKIQNDSDHSSQPLMNFQKGEPMTPGTAINFATSVFKQIQEEDVVETQDQERGKQAKQKKRPVHHKDSFVEVLTNVFPK